MRRHGIRQRIAAGLATVGLALGVSLATATPANAAIVYRHVYVHVTCNPGYYPSATYAGNYWQYVTYYGYDGYYFHWQVRLDTGIAPSQKATFNGYCNGLYGQPQYRKSPSASVTVAAATGPSYWRFI